MNKKPSTSDTAPTSSPSARTHQLLPELQDNYHKSAVAQGLGSSTAGNQAYMPGTPGMTYDIGDAFGDAAANIPNLTEESLFEWLAIAAAATNAATQGHHAFSEERSESEGRTQETCNPTPSLTSQRYSSPSVYLDDLFIELDNMKDTMKDTMATTSSQVGRPDDLEACDRCREHQLEYYI